MHEPLSHFEQQLLERFRKLSDHQQQAVVPLIEYFADGKISEEELLTLASTIPPTPGRN